MTVTEVTDQIKRVIVIVVVVVADFNFLYNYLTKEEKQHSQEFLLLFVI